MSIVIKGMRMPENCASCPFAERIPPGRTRCLLTCRLLAEDYEAPSQLKRNEYCPIEERPTPSPSHWIPIRRGERGYSAGGFRCSQCGTPDYGRGRTNFCSQCGAWMHGGKQNETT